VIRKMKLFCILGACLLLGCDEHEQATIGAEIEDGVEVSAYYGSYSARTKSIGKIATSLKPPKNEMWYFHDDFRSGHRIKIAVLFPNQEVNDPYWRMIREGIEFQARQDGFEIEIKQSENYDAIEQHKAQFIELAESLPAALIIGSIHFRAMDKLIQKAQQGGFGRPIPVVAVMNDVYAPTVSGKVMVSYADVGRDIGRYVLNDALARNKKQLRVALLPGPIHSEWAPSSLTGFVETIRAFPGDLDLIEPLWGTPASDVQRSLLEHVFEKHNSIDYLIANAVAAKEAVNVTELLGIQDTTQILSTYYTPALQELLQSGEVVASAYDHPVTLGRLSVHMVAGILSGKVVGNDLPFRVSRPLSVLTPDNIDELRLNR